MRTCWGPHIGAEISFFMARTFYQLLATVSPRLVQIYPSTSFKTRNKSARDKAIYIFMLCNLDTLLQVDLTASTSSTLPFEALKQVSSVLVLMRYFLAVGLLLDFWCQHRHLAELWITIHRYGRCASARMGACCWRPMKMAVPSLSTGAGEYSYTTSPSRALSQPHGSALMGSILLAPSAASCRH